MKKIISGALAAIMLAGMLCASAFAADTKITVSLRIEGLSETKLYTPVLEVSKGDKITVSEVVKQVLGTKDYVETEGQYGVYFSEIFGEAEYSATEYSGWNYRVNGMSPPVSASAYELEGGEDIVFYFGDMNTLAPEVKQVKTNSGYSLHFTAQSWDSSWEPIVINIPDVSVLWDGESIGKTDKDGFLALPQGKYAFGAHKLTYFKEGATVNTDSGEIKMPAVLRPSADNMFVVQFDDVKISSWAAKYVYALAQNGTVSGDGKGSFHPANTVKGYELALMLGNPELSDSREALTRDSAAAMLAEFLGDKLKKAESVDKYSDDMAIANRDAVYNLTAAGIFAGRGDNRFDPAAALRRDEASRLVCEVFGVK